jgi:hypothetical protein
VLVSLCVTNISGQISNPIVNNFGFHYSLNGTGDMKGFEINVLKGGKKFFNKYTPTLIIETWPENTKLVKEILNSMDYYLQKDLGVDNYLFTKKFSKS